MRTLNTAPMIDNQHGVSLVEVLIVSGLIGVTALVLASLMSSFSLQQRRMTEQLARSEVANFIIQAVNNTQACTITMTNPTQFSFDSTSLPAEGTVASGTVYFGSGAPAVAVGTAASPLTPNVQASSVRVVNITNSGQPDRWTGELEVTFDSSKLVMSLAPVRVRVLLQTDPASPAASKLVTSCDSGSTSLTRSVAAYSPFVNGATNVSCPSGYFLTQCHVEINSVDWKSHFHNNRVVYQQDADSNLIGCNANMFDTDDQYRLVAICTK